MQKKINAVAVNSVRLRLKINGRKALQINVGATPNMLEGDALEEADNFTYLRSIVYRQGGREPDIRVRIW